MIEHPPWLPARYELAMQLGTDGDIAEWLATDTSLDRPVLLRVLTGATPSRREEFLGGVRAAAAVTHTHIVDIFEAGGHGDVAYSVSEWAGGMTLADRNAAREPVGSDEFLPNAAGLAAALAALHDAGALHGAIDESAIFFSAAHPAKLAAFGRPAVATTPEDDTRMLAETLEQSLTGRPHGSVAPSQVIDSVGATVDTALSEAQTRRPQAQHLASTLRSAPTPRRRVVGNASWSWRWVVPTAGMALVAIILVGFGSSLVSGIGGERNVPTPDPSDPSPSPTLQPGESSPPPTDTQQSVSDGSAVTAIQAQAFDPFGGDGEHDDLSAFAIDGDFETAWKTESYFDPLPRLKPGVGITIAVEGSVAGIQASGVRDGSQWSLLWAPTSSENLDDWTLIANGTVRAGRFDTDVQVRQNGVWLIWFTDLPASNEGTFNTTVAEVRFRP